MSVRSTFRQPCCVPTLHIVPFVPASDIYWLLLAANQRPAQSRTLRHRVSISCIPCNGVSIGKKNARVGDHPATCYCMPIDRIFAYFAAADRAFISSKVVSLNISKTGDQSIGTVNLLSYAYSIARSHHVPVTLSLSFLTELCTHFATLYSRLGLCMIISYLQRGWTLTLFAPRASRLSA
jgi:hypothetical protein